jgi:glucose/arabinose dehydrogenase
MTATENSNISQIMILDMALPTDSNSCKYFGSVYVVPSYPIYILIKYVEFLGAKLFSWKWATRGTDISSIKASVLAFLALLAFTVFHPSVVASPDPDIRIEDSELELREVAGGLEFPTSMAFLDENRILVLEKEGRVKEIRDNKVLEVPVLNITGKVDSRLERGMLGVAISSDKKNVDNDALGDQDGREEPNTSRSVFLFYTEKIQGFDNNNECVFNPCRTNSIVANRLYEYQLIDNKLVDPQLILEIPGSKGNGTFLHLGGAMVTGPDNYLYLTTGDGKGCRDYRTCRENIVSGPLGAETANIQSGKRPAGMGGILRINMSEGEPVESQGILGDDYPLNLYYAYGIRNSFGLDFDPVTGRLWDTENGPAFGDEINLVEPGFNSGWAKIQGVWPVHDYTPAQEVFGYLLGENKKDQNDNQVAGRDFSPSRNNRDNLEDFNQKGKYSSPEFIWNRTVSPTGLIFFDSDKLGENYADDLFVGDYNNGNLYHFELNKNRTSLELSGGLSDKIANNMRELDSVIFGQGFNRVTDVEVGPDGFLYVLSFEDGSVYRIVPQDYEG